MSEHPPPSPSEAAVVAGGTQAAASGPQAPAGGGPGGGGSGNKGGGMRSTLLVSAATLGSRVLGLVREQLFAGLLGAGYYADAFVVAFRIPNLLRDLFAEGALSAAFVPTFTRVEKEQGKEAAYRTAQKVMGALLLIVGALTLLAMLLSVPLVKLLASGFSQVPGKVELTAFLATLMMPFLLLVSLAALLMGMLNARGRFGTPALAPALFNVASIGVGGGLWIAGVSPEVAVTGWSLGTVLGGALQLLIQVPPLRRDGFRFWPLFAGLRHDESLRRIASLMAPATVGLAATQLNIFINTQFASQEQGANAWLNYAFRLMYLPIGIFGVAIATVTATALARRAAEKDLAGLKVGLGTGLRHVAFLTVPSTVGLLAISEPLIALIYQHGQFGASDTAATARALAGYSLGLYAYSGVKVLAPAFYALEKPRLPLVASACAVAVNLLLNLALHERLGYLGLALGTSLGALANMAVLWGSFHRSTPEHPWPPGLLTQLLKVTVCSLIMGALVVAVDRGLLAAAGALALPVDSLLVRLARTGIGVGVGAVAYAGSCFVLKVGELREVLDALRRRQARRQASAR